MATKKSTKISSAKSQLDAQYGKGAGDYFEKMLKSGKSIDEIKNSFNSNKKTTSTNTSNSGYTNYTPYTKLTNKQPTKNTNPGGTGTDLSYVKSTDYYNSGVDWDYGADISKDRDRAKQMAYNLKADMKTNPKLFRSRSDYDKYYNYNGRSPSQQRMLDEFFDNANKYGLGATDNFYADMASEASTDKNNKLMSYAANKYNRLLPELNGIKQKLNDRLSPIFDRLMDAQTKYLTDMAELRKLQRQHYQGMTEAANNRAAGQAASMGSMMSGQGLSQSAIASSMMGAEKTWVEELNSNMKEHIGVMKELADAEGEFTNNWAGVVGNLSTQEQNALKNWYDSFKTLEDGLEDTYKTMVKEQYSPYEALTQAKVSGAAETLQSTGKSDVKQSEYQTGDTQKRARILYNNLSSIFGNYPDTLAKLSTYINSAAAQYSDFQTALTNILQKTGANNATVKNVINKINEFQQGIEGTEGEDKNKNTRPELVWPD